MKEAIAVVALMVLFWFIGYFAGQDFGCPDCPDAVVDTVYIGDHVDWMYFEQGLKCWDSVAVLNEHIDSVDSQICELIEWLQDSAISWDSLKQARGL